MKASAHKDQIHKILTDCEAARFSDLRLIWELLITEGHNPEEMTVKELFGLIKRNGFATFEAIRRARQKLQTSHPEISRDNTEPHQDETKDDLRETKWYDEI